MSCKVCGSECKSQGNLFCSNACFVKSRGNNRTTSCPICTGTNSAASLCRRHRRALYNRGWKPKPARERGGFDMDSFSSEDTDGLPIADRGPTELVVMIVRLIAAGIPYEDISEEAKCSLVYVKKTAASWSKKTKGALKRIRKINVVRNRLH